MPLRREHVLSMDCWCEPVMDSYGKEPAPMTPLEAARRLAATDPMTRVRDDVYGTCDWCGDYDQHKADCPWLAMPQIVAALEAAEAVSMSLAETRDGAPDFGVVQRLRRRLRSQ